MLFVELERHLFDAHSEDEKSSLYADKFNTVELLLF